MCVVVQLARGRTRRRGVKVPERGCSEVGFLVVGDLLGRLAENGLAFGSRNCEVQAFFVVARSCIRGVRAKDLGWRGVYAGAILFYSYVLQDLILLRFEYSPVIAICVGVREGVEAEAATEKASELQ